MSSENNEENNNENDLQNSINSAEKNLSESGLDVQSVNLSKTNSFNITNDSEKVNTNTSINSELSYEILIDFKGEADLSFKAIMIGDPFVGKSSLINKATKKKFDSSYSPTLGFDYYLFHIKIKNKILKLQIWDTCGQEMYQSLITNFYRNSSLAFLVYAINEKASFDHIENWLKEIKYQSNPDIKIFLIGNKSDLNEQRKVTYEEAQKYCDNYEFSGFYEVSAKTGDKAEEIMIKASLLLFEEYKDYHFSDKNNKKNKRDIILKSVNDLNDITSIESKNKGDGNSKSKCC